MSEEVREQEEIQMDDEYRDEPPAEEPEPGVWQRKFVRIVVGRFVLGVVLVGAAIIAFVAYRGSRNKPIELEQYPGSQKVSSEKLSDTQDHAQYVSTDSLDKIMKFYADDQEMDCTRQQQVMVLDETLYSQNPECPTLDTLVAGGAPVPCVTVPVYVCLVDRSTLDKTQYAKVTLLPGSDTSGLPTGQVFIDIRREWGN